MPKIGVVDGDAAVWASHTVPDHPLRMLVHQEGDETLPRLHEIEQPPDAVVPPHAHDCDEIIYVVAGELVLGSRTLHAGSSVFVPANTLYSFRSGPDGLRFVNFRPHGNVRSLLKDEFLRERGTTAEVPDDIPLRDPGGPA